MKRRRLMLWLLLPLLLAAACTAVPTPPDGEAPRLTNCGDPIATPARPPARRSRPATTPPPLPQPYFHQMEQATSADGLTWQNSRSPLFERVSVPDLTMTADGRLLVVAVDFTDVVENLALTVSTDQGATWSPLQEIRIWGWNDALGIPVDPDIMELRPGCFRLTFLALPRQPGPPQQAPAHRIYSAVSADAVTYVLEQGHRVEHAQIFDPDVIRLGDTWIMYIGHMVDGRDQTLVATSGDGLRYTLRPEPVATGAIPGAILLPDGRVRLYTVGKGGGVYTAADGLSFRPEGRLTGIPGLDPSVVRLKNGAYLMIHKTFMRR